MKLRNKLRDLKFRLAEWLVYPYATINYKVISLKRTPESINKRGRVVKITAPAEFTLETKHAGGKVVRIMPKQLKKMKEAQTNDL